MKRASGLVWWILIGLVLASCGRTEVFRPPIDVKGVVKGQVADEAGEPVSDVAVRTILHERADCADSIVVERTLTTDEEGAYGGVLGFDLEQPAELTTCVRIQADPPAESGLGSRELSGFTLILRHDTVSAPRDTLEVDFTLPSE